MRLVVAFALRWIATSFGLWLALWLFGTGEGVSNPTTEYSVYLLAGFILSVINIFIRPFVAIISLPITIVTLGLFTLIVNGLMVYLALQLTPDIDITFWSAVVAGIVIGFVNYVINETLGVLKAAT